jgi:hypothetical protein
MSWFRKRPNEKRALHLTLADKIVSDTGKRLDIVAIRGVGGMMGEYDVEVEVLDRDRNRDHLIYDHRRWVTIS